MLPVDLLYHCDSPLVVCCVTMARCVAADFAALAAFARQSNGSAWWDARCDDEVERCLAAVTEAFDNLRASWAPQMLAPSKPTLDGWSQLAQHRSDQLSQFLLGSMLLHEGLLACADSLLQLGEPAAAAGVVAASTQL